MTRRTPAQYDWATCSFDETILPAEPVRIHAPRRQPIEGVTIHHMAMVGTGDAALDACMRAWEGRPASAHYGVAADKNGVGHVRQYVWDSNEAWACADSKNSNGGNQTTLSIEHANSTAGPGWHVAEATWKTGAKLVAALHVLYELGRPVKGVTKNHLKVSGTVFRHHDWFSTACCGPYLDSIFDQYVAECQHQYDLMVAPPAPAHTLPSAVLDLTDWKLTLPTGTQGKPAEVTQPALSRYEDVNFMVDDPVDSVVFRAPCGGVTTSGSSYPRSELREMVGSKLAAWSSKSGTHKMSITQAITHLPVKKPHVIAGQIHDASTKVITIRLEGKHLFVEDKDGNNVGDLDTDYVLGTIFKVTISATKDGVTVYYAKTPSAPRVKVTVKVSGSGWYFKAGCYTQSNVSKGDAVTAYGQVVIRELAVTHEADSTAPPTDEKPKPAIVTLSDPRINESSGLAFSTIDDDVAYTLNDEDGVFFAIEPSTGNTVGTCKLPYTLIDPESMRTFDGWLWILDGGNNDLDRTTMVLYRLREPGRGNKGTIPKDQVQRYVLAFPDGVRRDCEALLIDPHGVLSVMTKGSPNGREFFVGDLSTTKVNPLTPSIKVPELITDATYVASGNNIIAVQKKRPGLVSVLDADHLTEVHEISVPRLAQCESITLVPGGEEFLIGTEGAKSPLIRGTIPEEYR